MADEEDLHENWRPNEVDSDDPMDDDDEDTTRHEAGDHNRGEDEDEDEDEIEFVPEIEDESVLQTAGAEEEEDAYEAADEEDEHQQHQEDEEDEEAEVDEGEEEEDEDDDDEDDEDDESEAPVLREANLKISSIVEHVYTTQHELASALREVGDIMAAEEAKFQRVNTEPNDDSEALRFQAVPVSFIGPLRSMFDSSRLPELIVYNYLFDDDMEVCTNAAYCLLSSGGQAIRYWSLDLTPEEERVFHRLRDWLKEAPQPLRCYATGLVAIFTDGETGDLAIESEMPDLLFRRLREGLQPYAKSTTQTPPVASSSSSSNPSLREDKGKEVAEITEQVSTNTVENASTPSDLEHQISTTELRYIVACISSIAEYQEILPPLYKENGVYLTLALLGITDTFVLFETLTMLNRLFAHKKFAHDFIDQGGLHALLQVPQEPYLSGGLALCFYSLSCSSTVMERILLFPEPLPSMLVKRTLWILNLPQDTARISACHFLSIGVSYPRVLELFDADSMAGVKTLIHILRTCQVRARGEGADSTPDTASKKQVISLAHAAMLCLKHYFRSHLLVKKTTTKAHLKSLATQKKRREYSRSNLNMSSSSLGIQSTPNKQTSSSSSSTARTSSSSAALLPNKAVDIDVNAAREAIEYFLGSPFESEESVSKKGERNKGVSTYYLSRSRWPHVEFFMKQDGYNVVFELIRQGLRWRYTEIAQFGLELIWLTSMLPFTQAAILNTTIESGERGIAIILDAASGGSQNPNKENNIYEFPEIIKGALGIIWVIAGLSKEEEALKHIWKSIRANNGISVLLSLLRIREPASHADSIRSLACRALLGIARDPTICQILSKLHITSRLLPDLMRDPVLLDNINEHSQFKFYALELMDRIAGKIDKRDAPRKERDVNLTINDALDPTFSKLERARIVNNTLVTYSDSELLQLVHEHLLYHGLARTAATLAEEANILPLSIDKPAHQLSQHSLSGREKSGRNTLDKMVVQYCVDQHKRCSTPIASLPPFSLLQPHRCPAPSNTPFPRGLRAPQNITKRLAAREMRTTPAHGGWKGGHMMRRQIYSRFRPVRVFRDEESVMTCTTFYNNKKILAGSHDGDVKIFDIDACALIGSWQCHDYSVMSLVASDNRRNLITFSHYDNGLVWDISEDLTKVQDQEPLYTLTDCKSGVFNRASTIIAATDLGQTTYLFSVQTGQKLATLKYEEKMTPKQSTFATKPCFNPSDDLILSYGVLWDPRYSRAIHKFDRLTSYGSGVFNPSGREVIINSEVWDLYTFKLLKTVPVLDKVNVAFNGLGDIMYGFPRKYDNITFTRPHTPQQNLFFTLDASDYSHIASIDVEKTIYDLALDIPDKLDRPGSHIAAPDNYIALVEYAPTTYADSVVRLYEVGRKKPDVYDSDLDEDDEFVDDFQGGDDDGLDEELMEEDHWDVLDGDADDIDEEDLDGLFAGDGLEDLLDMLGSDDEDQDDL